MILKKEAFNKNFNHFKIEKSVYNVTTKNIKMQILDLQYKISTLIKNYFKTHELI